MKTGLYIDGTFTSGAGEPEQILSPATGALIAPISSASPEQVDQAVGAAAAPAFVQRPIMAPKRTPSHALPMSASGP